jgi:predicted  nucleic acid-binding Zn-ribbon protein
MEKENEIVQFAVLEERLNKILDGYTTLKEEREKLISQMRVNEEEVEKLRNEVTTLKNERSEVRVRIERLIERLEGIPLE